MVDNVVYIDSRVLKGPITVENKEMNDLAFELMVDCVSSSVNCEAKVKAALIEKGVAEDVAADAAKEAFNKVLDIYN